MVTGDESHIRADSAASDPLRSWPHQIVAGERTDGPTADDYVDLGAPMSGAIPPTLFTTWCAVTTSATGTSDATPGQKPSIV
jgi:hypothetical protein